MCYVGHGETQIARSSTDVAQDMASMPVGESHQVPTSMNQSIDSARGHLAHVRRQGRQGRQGGLAVSLPPPSPARSAFQADGIGRSRPRFPGPKGQGYTHGQGAVVAVVAVVASPLFRSGGEGEGESRKRGLRCEQHTAHTRTSTGTSTSTHEVEPEPTSKHPCSVFQGQCPLGPSSRGGAVALGRGEGRDLSSQLRAIRGSEPSKRASVQACKRGSVEA